MELFFDDGTKIGFINNHGLFDIDSNKYVDFTLDNCKTYMGHRFVKCDRYHNRIATLLRIEIVTKYTNSYTLVTNQNINCIANGMLNITSVLYGVYNIFKYDKKLTFNCNEIRGDIEKYGLYEYSNFAHLIDKDVFDAYGFKYFKISIAKELMTYDILLFYIKWLKSCIDSGEALIYKGKIK